VRLRGVPISAVPWLWRWWRACRLRTYQANRLRMQRLAYFSRDCLHELTRSLKLDYERSDGYLVLLRSAQDLALVQPGLASLAELNTRFEMLDGAQCRIVEPGLNAETPLHAGIYLPNDEVGNCRQFSHLLRVEAQRRGARFRFHTTVERILPGASPQVQHVYAPPHEHSTLVVNADPAALDAQDTQPMAMHSVTETFDAVVVCAAIDSAPLLRPLGLRLPMQAVHGVLRRLANHKQGKGRTLEQVARDAAKYELLHPAVAIGAHHQKVGVAVIGHVQQSL